MILVLDRESNLHLFANSAEASSELELIDLQNSEYIICDERGHSLRANITEPVSAFRPGKFQLVEAGACDFNLPILLVKRAKQIGKSSLGLTTLEEVEGFLKRRAQQP